MSVFYDLASLVLVPSGYKASKVYAQKPLTAEGQLAFSRASTATRVNASGLIESVASNVPRLDYLGSTCPKLQLEPQRTNVLTYSEQIDNAAWTKFGSSASANQAVSPDGYTNGDKLLPNNGIAVSISASGIFTSGAAAYVRSGALTLTAASYTFSIFVKKAELDYVQLRSGTSVDLTANASTNLVNLNNGTPTVANTVQDYGNGWYRISHTFTATAATWYVGIWFWNTTNLTANGSQGILAYGAQLEAGAYATSYIPTTSAAVTRLADSASKTGISSLIGQTEGTLFVEAELKAYDGQAKWLAFLGTGSAYIGIYTDNSYHFTADVTYITTQFTNSSFSFAVGQRYKLALAYKANDFAFYVNGTQVATGNSGTVPATSQFDFNYDSSDVRLAPRNYSQALLFKTRLTNAQLAEITQL